MSTRTHWLRDKRITACGRNAFQSDIFEGSAAEYLGVSNFCVKCERSAQKAEALSVLRAFGSGKPKSLPAPQWPEPRPIAEAPKDGSEIQGWEPDIGWRVLMWWKNAWRLCGAEESTYEPTHFRPMPPAPEVRK